MAAAKKPAPRKPVTPRTPSTGTRKPMASPTPTRKSGPTVVLPNGSTVGLRDLGKVKPTPKPTVVKPKEYTPAQYDAILRKAQREATKKR